MIFLTKMEMSVKGIWQYTFFELILLAKEKVSIWPSDSVLRILQCITRRGLTSSVIENLGTLASTNTSFTFFYLFHVSYVLSSIPAVFVALPSLTYIHDITFYLAWWQAFMLLKAAIPVNFSSSEYLSPHKRRRNRVSPVSRASPTHMNSL